MDAEIEALAHPRSVSCTKGFGKKKQNLRRIDWNGGLIESKAKHSWILLFLSIRRNTRSTAITMSRLVKAKGKT